MKKRVKASIGLFILITGCAANEPHVDGEGKVPFRNAEGFFRLDAPNEYWIKVEGNGHSSAEQVAYYWHRLAVQNCGWKSYVADMKVNVEKSTDTGFFDGRAMVSVNYFPDAEGRATCVQRVVGENRNYQSISIQIKNSAPVESEKKFEKLSSGVKKEFEKLVSKGPRKLSYVQENSDLELIINVREVDYMGGMEGLKALVLLGAFLDRRESELVAEITISDTDSDKLLWYEQFHRSSDEGGSRAMKSQIQSLAYKVATILEMEL